ncbi:hypothetical protein DKX24_22695, partial [Enterobacter sp. HPCN14]
MYRITILLILKILKPWKHYKLLLVKITLIQIIIILDGKITLILTGIIHNNNGVIINLIQMEIGIIKYT